jgi:hypothetical protein
MNEAMNKPRLLAWTAGWWRDAAHAQRDADTWQGYKNWADRVRRCFKPIDVFVASGSWSDPALNPIPGGITVNAGCVGWTRPFNMWRTHYSEMAVRAALAYALNRVKDWDYLILAETDSLIGALDIPKLLSEFGSRSELLLAPGFCGTLGGPMLIWKPEGAIRHLHKNPNPSFADDGEPNLAEIPEVQWEKIFCGRKYWWNPWPQFECVIQNWGQPAWGPNAKAIDWPILGRPSSEEFAQSYINNHLNKCLTL